MIFIHICLSSQEDDIDGIHIVAFAEEEDPGKCIFTANEEIKIIFSNLEISTELTQWYRN